MTRWAAIEPNVKRFVALVVGAFVLYNLNLRELGLTDTAPATLLAASLVRQGDLELGEFRELLQTTKLDGHTSLARQVEFTSAIREIDGELRSSYPVGAALLATPVYAVPAWFGLLRDYHDYRLAAKLAASSMVALSAGFVFLSLARFCAPAVGLLLAGLYAFGTGAWTIASQALWQHGPGMLCLSVALWLALRLDERKSRLDAALLSLALGLALVCRPQNLFAVLALGGYALLRHRRSWAVLLAPAALLGIWQVVYNLRVFYDLRGGYPALYHSEAHAFRGLTADSVFTLPLLEGLAGLLVSPGKGLFVYTPAMLLPLLALPILAFRQPRSLAPWLGLWAFGTLLVLAKNRLWWGGTCYGPRYLLEVMVALTIATGMLWQRLPRAARIAFAVAGAYGVYVQVVGMLTWECGWHHSPKWLDFAPERLWDFRDPEVLRCSEVLFSEGPRPPDLGPFAP